MTMMLGILLAARVMRALFAATASAYAAGVMVGAANPLSMFIVALGFATCSTAGVALIVRARSAKGGTSAPD